MRPALPRRRPATFRRVARHEEQDHRHDREHAKIARRHAEEQRFEVPVILATGLVGDVRIHKSLDKVFGLDEEALKSARAWRFKPALKDGQPVPFKVIIQLEFRIDPKTPADLEFEKGAERQGTPGLVMPEVAWEEKPKYTAEAMRNKVQGIVGVQVVVGPDGKVVRARIVNSLDKTYGLDDEALTAAKRWRFKPGTLNGAPVPVLMTIQLEFRLH